MSSIWFSSRLSLPGINQTRQWQWLKSFFISRRHRSDRANKQRLNQAQKSSRFARPFPTPSLPTFYISQKDILSLQGLEDSPAEIIRFCESNVPEWVRDRTVWKRLAAFGVPQQDISPSLSAFSSEMSSGHFRNNQHAYDNYGFRRLAYFHTNDPPSYFTDVIFTSIFYSWASDPLNQESLSSFVPRSTVEGIRRLANACERRYPAEEFPSARRMKRKIIMHVGPTNSGKTYHALRALAAAPSGVYAGPLRLLAHEIWERLNQGTIVPAGIEMDPSDAAQKDGRVQNHSRPCNMVTGEEQKIVSDSAPLVSCTVEMLSFHNKVDVAVVDEIQLIADGERGYAWTAAVLGLCAKEIHLCGEETAVPLVQALLRDTGDEIIVKAYDRLTPLVAQDVPIRPDLRDISKGDCIVAFSRTKIFALKKQVEATTGLRCAVVYGRLPPEVRSKQAELFNDPASKYDVIIGSDAIGMGLNLYVSESPFCIRCDSLFGSKIRRIIFEDVEKRTSPSRKSKLTISQVKQIAGRAGRYGLLTDKAPGYTTAFNDYCLQYIKKCLQEPFLPLQTARLSPDANSNERIAKALPFDASTETLYNAHLYVSNLSPRFQYMRVLGQQFMCATIDALSGVLSLRDRTFLSLAPIPWREDEPCIAFITKLISAYQGSYVVHVQACLNESGLMKNFNYVEAIMNGCGTGSIGSDMISKLEGLHRVLGLYSWLSYRRPVAFSSVAEVNELKPRVEATLHWALNAFSKLSDVSRSKQKRPSQARIGHGGNKILLLNRTSDKHVQSAAVSLV